MWGISWQPYEAPEAAAAKNLSLKDGEFFGGYFGWRGGGVEGKPKAFLKSRGGRISE